MSRELKQSKQSTFVQQVAAAYRDAKRDMRKAGFAR